MTNTDAQLLLVTLEKRKMEALQSQQPSVFAQMVDGLRNKSEEELKLLYLRFFAADLANEWKTITATADFNDAGDEDIMKAIQKKPVQAIACIK